MYLLKVISKTKTHQITVKNEEGKEVKKDIPNSCTLLVLDSGVKLPISCVKKEDIRVLDSHCKVEYK